MSGRRSVSVDFGSQYKITEPFSVYLNVKNLTNTPLKFTEGPGPDRSFSASSTAPPCNSAATTSSKPQCGV